MNKQCETELSKKDEFTAYYKLDHKSDLVEEIMLLDVAASEELMKRNIAKSEKEGTPFLNASTTADQNLDYVEGFIIMATKEEMHICEYGWNRKRNENVVINVSPIKNKDGTLIYPRNYFEVIRFPLEKIGECIGKTDGCTPFFLYFDEYQEDFDKALRSIKAKFPKASYSEEFKEKLNGKKVSNKKILFV